jgi:hypothetical protein
MWDKKTTFTITIVAVFSVRVRVRAAEIVQQSKIRWQHPPHEINAWLSRRIKKNEKGL